MGRAQHAGSQYRSHIHSTSIPHPQASPKPQSTRPHSTGKHARTHTCARARPHAAFARHQIKRCARARPHAAFARHQIKRWGQGNRTSTASSGAGRAVRVRCDAADRAAPAPEAAAAQKRGRRARRRIGAHLMLSGGPGRKTSAAEPAYGGGKCGAGAAESAWQAEGAAAAAVRHWRELQARLWSITSAAKFDCTRDFTVQAWKLLKIVFLTCFFQKGVQNQPFDNVLRKNLQRCCGRGTAAAGRLGLEIAREQTIGSFPNLHQSVDPVPGKESKEKNPFQI